jgi:rod shape determining protein RodA
LDWSLIASVIFLSTIGLVVLYSAAEGDFFYWSSKQLLRFCLGLVLMLSIALTPWNIWRALSYGAYIVSFIMLVYVDLFGHIGMGAQRWINLYFFQLQPSEIVKITITLAIARYYSSVHFKTNNLFNHCFVLIFFIGLPTALVLRQPDLGTAMILLTVGLTIMFMAGLHWGYFLGGGVLSAISAPFLWTYLHSYQQQRILTFLNPENDPLGAGYHIIQSKIAVGSAGVWGKGFMNGSQNKLDFLPEKQTDFIFTTFTEEFGFIGALLLIAAYTFLFYCCYRIVLRFNQTFPRLMVAGLITTFFLYFFINIGMVIGIMPVVGVPLPLMTYGGTATLTMMMSIGLILSADLSHRMKRSVF